MQSPFSTIQAQHSDGPVGTLILRIIDNRFSGGDETAFFHYPPAGRVVDEVSGNKGFDISPATDMLDHQPQGLRANTSVPVWFGDSVTGERLAVPPGTEYNSVCFHHAIVFTSRQL